MTVRLANPPTRLGLAFDMADLPALLAALVGKGGVRATRRSPAE